MRGNGPIGLGQLADAAADATWTLGRSQSPLVGPAAAQTARVGGSARKRYRKAYRRAAKHRVYKGGQVHPLVRGADSSLHRGGRPTGRPPHASAAMKVIWRNAS